MDLGFYRHCKQKRKRVHLSEFSWLRFNVLLDTLKVHFRVGMTLRRFSRSSTIMPDEGKPMRPHEWCLLPSNETVNTVQCSHDMLDRFGTDNVTSLQAHCSLQRALKTQKQHNNQTASKNPKQVDNNKTRFVRLPPAGTCCRQ